MQAQASSVQVREVGRVVKEEEGGKLPCTTVKRWLRMWWVLLRAGLTLWHVQCAKEKKRERKGNLNPSKLAGEGREQDKDWDKEMTVGFRKASEGRTGMYHMVSNEVGMDGKGPKRTVPCNQGTEGRPTTWPAKPGQRSGKGRKRKRDWVPVAGGKQGERSKLSP